MTIATNREFLDYGSDAGSRWRGVAQQVINGEGTTRQLLVGESGALCIFGAAAGQIYNLPVIGADDIGIWFEFSVTVDASSNSYTVNTGSSSNFMGGGIVATSTTPGDEDVFSPTIATDVAMTLDRVEDGWLAGGFFTFTAISLTEWTVGGQTVTEPAAADPFS